MLERIHGLVVFMCDECDDELETETSDFTEARQMLDREGWRTSKVGDEWVHHCPDCRLKKRGLFS